VRAEREQLCKLDAACGDGDHGESLARVFEEVEKRIAGCENCLPGDLLITAGRALIAGCGGATGPIMGTFFMEAGCAAGQAAELDLPEFTRMFRAGYEGVRRRGGAEPGQKTVLDALMPATAALEAALEGKVSLVEALLRAADAAEEGARQTAGMIARQGKARYLGERSLGHPDAGACSVELIIRTMEEALQQKRWATAGVSRGDEEVPQ
jgi:dihydroxyacetone kinase-like protein